MLYVGLWDHHHACWFSPFLSSAISEPNIFHSSATMHAYPGVGQRENVGISSCSFSSSHLSKSSWREARQGPALCISHFPSEPSSSLVASQSQGTCQAQRPGGPQMSHYGGPESGDTEFQSGSQSLAAILLRFSRTVPISCHIIIFIKMAHYISNQMWFNFYAIYGTFHLNKSTNQKNKSLAQCQGSALGFGNKFPLFVDHLD